MKKSLSLLVVEDTDSHYAEFERALDRVAPYIPVEISVKRAKDLDTGLALIAESDLIITDVFLPDREGGLFGYGRTIVENALSLAKPVVWISDTYHHDRNVNDLSIWGRAHGLEMFDNKTDYENVGDTIKPWAHALIGVLAIYVGLEDGVYAIDSSKIVAAATDVSVGYLTAWIAKQFLKVEDLREGNLVIQLMLEMGFRPIPKAS